MEKIGRKDFNNLNEYVKEFLKFNNYGSTLECFEAEEKTKQVTLKRGSNDINKIPNVGFTPQISSLPSWFPLSFKHIIGQAEGEVPQAVQVL